MREHRGKRSNAVPSPALPAAMLLLAVTACAQVTIHAGDGTVSERTRFGIVSIEPRPGTTAQIIDLQGIGLIAQSGAMTLGHLSSSMAMLPAGDCRIVLWLEDTTAPPASLAGLLDGTPELCAVGPGTDRPTHGGDL